MKAANCCGVGRIRSLVFRRRVYQYRFAGESHETPLIE
jgi:hypothetical protein